MPSTFSQLSHLASTGSSPYHTQLARGPLSKAQEYKLTLTQTCEHTKHKNSNNKCPSSHDGMSSSRKRAILFFLSGRLFLSSISLLQSTQISQIFVKRQLCMPNAVRITQYHTEDVTSGEMGAVQHVRLKIRLSSRVSSVLEFTGMHLNVSQFAF